MVEKETFEISPVAKKMEKACLFLLVIVFSSFITYYNLVTKTSISINVAVVLQGIALLGILLLFFANSIVSFFRKKKEETILTWALRSVGIILFICQFTSLFY